MDCISNCWVVCRAHASLLLCVKNLYTAPPETDSYSPLLTANLNILLFPLRTWTQPRLKIGVFIHLTEEAC